MLLLLSVNLHYFNSSERDMSIQETYKEKAHPVSITKYKGAIFHQG